MLKMSWDLWLLFITNLLLSFSLKEFLKLLNTGKVMDKKIDCYKCTLALSCWKMNSPRSDTWWAGTVVTASHNENRPHWPCVQDRQVIKLLHCRPLLIDRLTPPITDWTLTVCGQGNANITGRIFLVTVSNSWVLHGSLLHSVPEIGAQTFHKAL